MLSVQTVHSEPVLFQLFPGTCTYSQPTAAIHMKVTIITVQMKYFNFSFFQSNVIIITVKGSYKPFKEKEKIWFELLTTSSDLHSLSQLMQIYNRHLHSLSNFIPQLTPLLSKLYLFSMKCEYSWLNENISSDA